MSTTEIIAILTAPLTPAVGAMFILIGLYSITFNVADAKYKNHRRAEKAARIGGWFYIIVGATLVSQRFF
jgi:hypothetical protein